MADPDLMSSLSLLRIIFGTALAYFVVSVVLFMDYLWMMFCDTRAGRLVVIISMHGYHVLLVVHGSRIIRFVLSCWYFFWQRTTTTKPFSLKKVGVGYR
jgi:hypothetical protein